MPAEHVRTKDHFYNEPHPVFTVLTSRHRNYRTLMKSLELTVFDFLLSFLGRLLFNALGAGRLRAHTVTH